MSSHVPIAQSVSTSIDVDSERVAQLVAETDREERTKYYKALVDADKKRQSDIFVVEKKHKEELHQKDKQHQEVVFRATYPQAAVHQMQMDREKRAVEEEKKDRENVRLMERNRADAEREVLLHDKHLADWKENVKMTGILLLGVGSSMMYYSSNL